MRRVVVTGLGAISCIGNNQQEILDSLRNGRSGIVFNESFAEMGLRSHVSGTCNIDPAEHIDRKIFRFMGDAAAYAYLSMQQAVADAGLEESDISNVRTGLIASSGGASAREIVRAADVLRDRGVRKIGPYSVTKTMSSSISACLATPFKVKGVNYSLTSACATSAHCIGVGAELIQFGKQDIIFAGGGEELDWSLACLFDAMGALSSSYNDAPATASRPYDATRDGFVIAGGGGIVVLEELEHARARGAKIYAELVGFGSTSDGYDMVAPSGEGAQRCMQMAKATVDAPIDYINTHGTSTPVGDVKELEGMRAVFGDKVPRFGSSKSLCGHSLGATGVQEAIHCLLMLEHDFIAPSINVNEPDPAVDGMPLVTELIEQAGIRTAMSNSFGFGGTNGTLVFQKN
ncbi:MAG: beta-ketoacyl-ACP synthase I [Gammaproteobacteria bacterium]|nr:beta-ketoacyl-ACP synthase I [Gammaproteobacteria bacterium]MDH5302658.1 beta-ketoacyl-ACP synthase I [Gammaproteobacteria bacterium]MDH5320905.1 beta-ketoacyl-ACP synthase I [Gammaproteobacteria bacterium]